MINYTPIPVLMQIGSIKIYSWGVMLAIAIIVAVLLILKKAQQEKLSKQHCINIVLISIIVGLIFAHLGWLVENKPRSFIDIINITSGLAFFPGFIAGLLAGITYVKCNKLNLMHYLDVFMLYFPLAHAIARIGCFLNWDDYGKYTNVAWAIKVQNDLPRHPTQIYHVIANLCIFAVLMIIDKKKKKNYYKQNHGIVFVWYLFLYSITRFIIEFWRDNPLHYGLTASQWFCLGMFLFAICMSISQQKKNQKSKSKKLNQT